jgi:glycosyltransferase involved in cell wall biosynthesis
MHQAHRNLDRGQLFEARAEIYQDVTMAMLIRRPIVKRTGIAAFFGQLKSRSARISSRPTEAMPPPRLLDSEDGYNFVGAHGKVFGVPQSLGPVDLGSEDISARSGVIVGDLLPDVRMRAVRQVIRTAPRIPVTSMLSTPANVAFYGANHPALAPLFSPNHDDEIRVLDTPHDVEASSIVLGRLDYALRTFRARMTRAGVSDRDIETFIDTRDYVSQMLASSRGGIHFFQGAPLTLGVNPWMIQIEKASTLLLPFITPGNSYGFDRRVSPIYRIIRALLLSDDCVGIITNIRATRRDVPVLFDAPSLAQKLYYLPFFLEPPAPIRKRPRSFLFTSSWHQHERNFYSRGGVDAAMIFAEIAKRHRDARLVMRCNLPADLPEKVRSVLDAPNVRIVDHPISDEEMGQLFAEAQFYLLPAPSLHSMSTLQAMANGCVCVLADSWGSDEYLHHGVDGLRIPGREGKHWEYRANEAFLAERYDGLEIPDLVFVRGAVEAIDRLMLNEAHIQGISDAARSAAARSNSALAGRKAFAEILRDIRSRMARP